MQAVSRRGPPLANLRKSGANGDASSQTRALEKCRDRRKSLVALLEHSGKEIETVRHPIADEMLHVCSTRRAQLFREGAVVVDERISRAGGDERGGISVQIGTRRAGVRMSQFLWWTKYAPRMNPMKAVSYTIPSGASRSNDLYCSKKKSVIGASSTAACGTRQAGVSRLERECRGDIAAG